MVKIPLGVGDWKREVAKEARIHMENRYFEQTPTNLEDQVSLLARPAAKRILNVGDGPVRAQYSQPGTFDEAMFVISNDDLYRVDTDQTVTLIGNGLFTNLLSSPSMVATGLLVMTMLNLNFLALQNSHVPAQR